LPPSNTKISPVIRARAKKIRVLLMDADGTLTDGRVWLISEPDDQSAVEMKVFDAHDGAGLTLVRSAGIRTGIITGRESPAMRRRAKEMKIEFLYERVPEKIPIYEEILRIARVTDAEVAYVGDDLPDIPVMQRVGLAIAVGDATPETKRAAHYVTKALGGRGGVREAIELIMKSQGIWEKMLNKARA
jgi:3-deoxy-D-manno-octulosonate 8-phosphate phosphatase (KDO 8-P phosphatase)